MRVIPIPNIKVGDSIVSRNGNKVVDLRTGHEWECIIYSPIMNEIKVTKIEGNKVYTDLGSMCVSIYDIKLKPKRYEQLLSKQHRRNA